MNLDSNVITTDDCHGDVEVTTLAPRPRRQPDRRRHTVAPAATTKATATASNGGNNGDNGGTGNAGATTKSR